MKTTFFLLSILVVAVGALAQPPDTLWTRTYGGMGGDIGNDVIQTNDGNFVVTGSISIIGTQPPSHPDVYLSKVDSAGNVIWQRNFGGIYLDFGYSVQQTTDNGFIIAGYTIRDNVTNNEDAILIKTDADGNLVWERRFGTINDDRGYCVRQTTDGGYIITGYTLIGSTRQAYLLKTDSTGNPMWWRTFGSPLWAEGHSVQQTLDGGYIIAGRIGISSIPYNTDIFLIKTDNQGDLIWQNNYGGNLVEEAFCVLQSLDGGYVICGSVYGVFSSSDVYILKTDTNGNLVWNHTYGGYSEDEGYCIRQTADDGFIIVGRTNSFFQSSTVYIIKTDDNGHLLWDRTFGDPWESIGLGIVQTRDGGYILTGYTAQTGNGDIYLIRLVQSSMDFNIETVPVNPPINIPVNGGNFQYSIAVNNWTTQPQTFQIWNKVRDAANVYTSVFGPITRSLPGGANPTRTLTQTISGSIASGTLYFISYIGNYPAIVDSSYFTITKSTTADGGPWISESTCEGDLFDYTFIPHPSSFILQPFGFP
jgi:hypothetical protein